MPRYEIVPQRSTVWIDAKSTLHPIHARTDGLEGYVELEVGDGGAVDLNVTPAGRLSLPVTRLRSGNRLEDRELHNRLDARRYPTIDGVLTSMKAARADSPSGSRFVVQGDVSFRGVTRSMKDHMTVRPIDGRTIQLEGESTFDIRDFGMEPPRILLLRVEPSVTVRVEIVAEREG